jgi:hypothetical protein
VSNSGLISLTGSTLTTINTAGTVFIHSGGEVNALTGVLNVQGDIIMTGGTLAYFNWSSGRSLTATGAQIANNDMHNITGNTITLSDSTATLRDITLAGDSTISIDYDSSLTIRHLTIASGEIDLVDGTFTAESVSVSTGRIDLHDNHMTVRNGELGSWDGVAYTGATGLVQRGRGDGSWNGDGIVTSMTDATTSVLTTLAVRLDENGDVRIMYTWGGDADLNGDLNGDDYFILDPNITFAQNSPSFPTGAGGGGGVGGLTTVPERGIMTGIGVALWAMQRRRRG